MTCACKPPYLTSTKIAITCNLFFNKLLFFSDHAVLKNPFNSKLNTLLELLFTIYSNYAPRTVHPQPHHELSNVCRVLNLKSLLTKVRC